jgi:hypothetical protein
MATSRHRDAIMIGVAFVLFLAGRRLWSKRR